MLYATDITLWLLVTELTQVNRHLRLLAYLNEHEFAHADVVILWHGSPSIEINLVCGQRLEQVFKCEISAVPMLLQLVEDDLQYAFAKVHLANDNLLALAHATLFTFLRRLRTICCLVWGLGRRMYRGMRELSHNYICVVLYFLFSNAKCNLTELI